MRAFPKFILITTILFQACKNHQATNKTVKTHTANIDTLQQYDLEDSNKLTLIKDLFYKSKSGHLYQRTIAQVVNFDKSDSLMWREYFNGTIPQDLDPETFEQLDGWYAKDKNFIYYNRPVSGGMLISKIENADFKTFKVLKGHYQYAADKNHVFEDMNEIDKLNPTSLKINYDQEGKIVSLQSGQTIYKTN